MDWLSLLSTAAALQALEQEIHAPHRLHRWPAGSPVTKDLVSPSRIRLHNSATVRDSYKFRGNGVLFSRDQPK